MVALGRALLWTVTLPATRLALLLPAVAVPAIGAVLLRVFTPALLADVPDVAFARLAARLVLDAVHATLLAAILVETVAAARQDEYAPLPLAWFRYRERLNAFVRHAVVTLPVFAAVGFWLWLTANFVGASRIASAGIAHLPVTIPFAALEALILLIGFPPLGLLVIASLFLCGYAALLLGALLDGRRLTPREYWRMIRPHWARWLVLILALHVVYGFVYGRLALIGPISLFGPEPIPTFRQTVEAIHAPPRHWTETWPREALSEAIRLLGILLIGFAAGILNRAQESRALGQHATDTAKSRS